MGVSQIEGALLRRMVVFGGLYRGLLTLGRYHMFSGSQQDGVETGNPSNETVERTCLDG